ncbi:ABC transporter substrate-binding protein [Phytomonospora endophytica]|uniref:Alpha-glucoside transport system substrate-binding protein n=1 Tax=Phytomonospora endophytica TaxID=714109 RepID=A0A841FR74_9ACTN|nr:ABC transporter substrate-binding protein [Phytomonospora endophytica]MBB6034460.1 alpha-glucoside transport system substrate-binding protein [Phytomonospora endophytica]GIG70366.1 alpha-glucoside ABC transporter substrate-binding protein [Phytomonospora endophytica]
MSIKSKALHRRRWLIAVAGAVSVPLAMTGCGKADDSANVDCTAYAEYGEHKDTEVSIYSTVRDAEADQLTASWKDFQSCTGIKIDYEGTGDFETQIGIRVNGGNAPDIAIFPQPGLMATFADKLKPASDKVKELATANYTQDWINYGTVNGTLYGTSFDANVKSFVWYSPKLFADKGYTVPTTWAELITLTDKIKADGIDTPWCAGIESGEATGWPATDWVEDMVLRTAGPEVYDQWVKHEIPFNDPKIVAALERVGTILRNPEYVGDVKSIATTSFQAGGLPILDGKCGLHRQASFYAAQWPEGTKVAEDGDVFAFYLPGDDAANKPLLGAGQFVTAFADRPEVETVRQFLAGGTFFNERMKKGPFTTANNKADISNAADPVIKLSMELLRDTTVTFRFDASDLMPAEVGASKFWTEMTAWIAEGKDTKAALDAIEGAWPA